MDQLPVHSPDPRDGEWALPSTVLARQGPWVLLAADPGHATASTQALWDAFVSVFNHAARALQQRWPLPEGTLGHAILDPEAQACLDWGMDETQSLGFQAIIAPAPDMASGVFVPDDHRCYVNLAASVLALEDEPDDRAARLATLATLPHEMAHVALLARHLQGLSPRHVFHDQGQDGLAMALQAVEDLAHAAGYGSELGANEDQAEEFGQSVVDAWLATDPAAPALAGAIGPAPAPRAPGPR